MGLIQRYSAYLACLTGVLLLVTAITHSHRLYQRLNDRAAQTTMQTTLIDDESPAETLFARARQLERAQQDQAALRLYNRIEHSENAQLNERVQYNMGVLYLRQAASHWHSQGVRAHTEINPLLDLAERSFRQVLTDNPGNWDARYNLEYALRIRPPAKQVEKGDWQGQKSSVFAILPGVPGGGP